MKFASTDSRKWKLRLKNFIIKIFLSYSVLCTIFSAANEKLFQVNVCNSDGCKKIGKKTWIWWKIFHIEYADPNNNFLNLASEILERMNNSVNPCDDLYEFMCGTYSKNAQIPEDESSLSSIKESRKIVQKRLKTSIESEITESHPRTFKILKSFYDSCLKKGK